MQQYNAGDLTAAIDTSDGGDAQRVIATGRYTTVTSSGAGVEVSGWMQGVRTHLFLTMPEDGVQQQEEELDRRVAFGRRRGWGGTARRENSPPASPAGSTSASTTCTRRRIASVEDTTTLNNGQYLSGSLFGRWQKFAWSKVAFDVGARLDVLQYGSQNLQVATAPMVHATSVQVSPKFGARYILSSKAALLASVARGFRGAPGVVTDPSLPPLSLWGIEVGTQLVFGGFTADLALFRMDVQNERIQDPGHAADPRHRRQLPAGRVCAAGLAGEQRLSFQANATWNNATIKESDPPSVTPVAALDGAARCSSTRPSCSTSCRPSRGTRCRAWRTTTRRSVASSASAGARWWARGVRLGGPFTPIGEPDVQTQPYAVLDLGGQLPLGRSGPMLDIACRMSPAPSFPKSVPADSSTPALPSCFAWR